jgi:hypothetical protein
MQIQAHVEGDSLVVTIPTAGGPPMEQVIPLTNIDNSDRANPAVISFADPHPATTFSKPLGERPIFEQTQLAVDHNALAMNIQRKENPDLLDPPNSSPEQKTQQDSIRGPGSTAQIGMTLREMTGEVPEEGEPARIGAGIATNLPVTAYQTNAERPAASLPDSKTPGSEMPELGVNVTRGDRVPQAGMAPETLDGEPVGKEPVGEGEQGTTVTSSQPEKQGTNTSTSQPEKGVSPEQMQVKT